MSLHLVEVDQHRPTADTQRIAMAGLMNVEHRLNRRVEALHVEGLIDRDLWNAAMAQETERREALQGAADRWPEVEAFLAQ